MTDIGQLVLAGLFFAVWIVDGLILEMTPLSSALGPIVIRAPVGGVLLTIAGFLAVRSHRIIFGERREDPHVVSKSVFAVVRHPMYLSEILLYLGLLFLSPSAVALGVWLLVIGFLHVVARREEALLLERFGDEYETYRKDVPMWLPLCRSRRVRG